MFPLLSYVRDATSRDLRLALTVVRRLNADDPKAEPEALTLLGRLVGCDQASVTINDHVSRRMTAAISSRPERNLFRQPGFSVAVAQHPAFAAYRSGALATGSSAALSDLNTAAALRRLPLYVDYYRPQGTVDQLLGLAAITGRQGLVVALNRSRIGFSRRDRALVDLLAPHFAQAADRRKRTAALAAAARVRAWRDEQPSDVLSRLTGREQQVALLLADGATDQQIARSLGITARTVHKHVEHIYRKLELTNRTTLTALIYRGTDPPPP